MMPLLEVSTKASEVVELKGETPFIIACENKHKKAGFIAIGNVKTFLLGTFHGVTGNYLQEYLNEFGYRYSRRFVEKQIPNRLLKLIIIHTPLKST
jgi:hypothetical protein